MVSLLLIRAACTFHGAEPDRMKTLAMKQLYRAASRRAKTVKIFPGKGNARAECRAQLRPLAGVDVFSLDIPFYRTGNRGFLQTFP